MQHEGGTFKGKLFAIHERANKPGDHYHISGKEYYLKGNPTGGNFDNWKKKQSRGTKFPKK